ncbi:hypothetical protein D9M68_754960 [compost metagenome]
MAGFARTHIGEELHLFGQYPGATRVHGVDACLLLGHQRPRHRDIVARLGQRIAKLAQSLSHLIDVRPEPRLGLLAAGDRIPVNGQPAFELAQGGDGVVRQRHRLGEQPGLVHGSIQRGWRQQLLRQCLIAFEVGERTLERLGTGG